MLVEMKDLSFGERLRTVRRREGLTQANAAAAYGMPLGAYKMAERDQPQAWSIPAPVLRTLRTYEACLILRKRLGLTLDQLSDEMGISKWWLCLMEQGKAPVGRLSSYWGM
jgi:transcriptional regulator with XRE-family HTH domain